MHSAYPDPIPGMPRLVGLQDLLTLDEAIRFHTHLHNGNSTFDFGMAFRDDDGETEHVRSKTVPFQTAIRWGIETIFRRGNMSKAMAFMPYPRNETARTCWGALDFDAHDGNVTRARNLAFAAWNHIQDIRPGLCVILETSNSGGWHVGLVKEQLIPCAAVTTFLADVAREVGTEVRRGICELFPHSSNSNNLAYALRAFGSFHPGTNSCMRMTACNLSTLIVGLASQETPNDTEGLPIKKRIHGLRDGNKKKKTIEGKTEDRFGKNELHNHGTFEAAWAARYRINEPSTRNYALKIFVQKSYQQLGKDTARRIATCQFAQKTVPTQADLEEHMRDFETLWTWCEETFWQPKLIDADRAMLTFLKTDTERDAFRILWSFNAFAVNSGANDFPITQDNFARRLGLTSQSAGKMITRFIRCGIIERTDDYISIVKSARYKWFVARRPLSILVCDRKDAVLQAAKGSDI